MDPLPPKPLPALPPGTLVRVAPEAAAPGGHAEAAHAHAVVTSAATSAGIVALIAVRDSPHPGAQPRSQAPVQRLHVVKHPDSRLFDSYVIAVVRHAQHVERDDAATARTLLATLRKQHMPRLGAGTGRFLVDSAYAVALHAAGDVTGTARVYDALWTAVTASARDVDGDGGSDADAAARESRAVRPDVGTLRVLGHLAAGALGRATVAAHEAVRADPARGPELQVEVARAAGCARDVLEGLAWLDVLHVWPEHAEARVRADEWVATHGGNLPTAVGRLLRTAEEEPALLRMVLSLIG